MLGTSKIVSIKEYNATNKKYCNKCESYEWNHTISFKNGDKYLLCYECVRFFISIISISIFVCVSWKAI